MEGKDPTHLMLSQEIKALGRSIDRVEKHLSERMAGLEERIEHHVEADLKQTANQLQLLRQSHQEIAITHGEKIKQIESYNLVKRMRTVEDYITFGRGGWRAFALLFGAMAAVVAAAAGLLELFKHIFRLAQ